MNENEQKKKTIYIVSIISIIANIILALGKIIAGVLAKTNSLISDGVHTTSDILSTIVVMIGAKLSIKEPDEDHPFGHERLESVATIILGMLLVGTAFILAYTGIETIVEYAKGNVPTRNDFIYVGLGFAIGSVVVKFIMFLYTKIYAKKLDSTSLSADAYHHLSDSLSSIPAILGIVGILVGGQWAILDPIATLVIVLFILKVAYDVLKEAIDQLVDKSAPKEFNDSITEFVNEQEDVLHLNSIKTRQFGSKYYIEIAIAVDPNLTVLKGHEIGSRIHHKIEDMYPMVKHCVIHIDPHIKTKK